jgi:RimJ/RimL family protein N-acetyltransferase
MTKMQIIYENNKVINFDAFHIIQINDDYYYYFNSIATISIDEKADILALCEKNDYYYMHLRLIFEIYQLTNLYFVCMLIYTNDHKLVSFGFFNVVDDKLEIGFMLVDKNHRSKQLSKTILTTAQNLSYINIHSKQITIETDNTESLRYFLKQGFRVFGKNERFLKLILN